MGKSKKPSFRWDAHWIRTVEANMHAASGGDVTALMRLAYAGVKYIIYCDHQSPSSRFQEIMIINGLIGKLTPTQFQNVFPIAKSYDGERYEIKDYFSTKAALTKYSANKPIGDKVLEFLWDYHNMTTSFYVVESMSAVSDLRMMHGGKSLVEEWFEDSGIKMHRIDGGNTQNTYAEQSHPERKERPWYLKLLKTEKK